MAHPSRKFVLRGVLSSLALATIAMGFTLGAAPTASTALLRPGIENDDLLNPSPHSAAQSDLPAIGMIFSNHPYFSPRPGVENDDLFNHPQFSPRPVVENDDLLNPSPQSAPQSDLPAMGNAGVTAMHFANHPLFTPRPVIENDN